MYSRILLSSRTITSYPFPSEKVNASTGKQYIYDWVLPTAETRVTTWGNLNATGNICTMCYYWPICMDSQYSCPTGVYTDMLIVLSCTLSPLSKWCTRNLNFPLLPSIFKNKNYIIVTLEKRIQRLTWISNSISLSGYEKS